MNEISDSERELMEFSELVEEDNSDTELGIQIGVVGILLLG